MDPLSDLFINNLLRTNEQGILFQREDDQVEYKAIFDNSSKEAKAKYAKELAALYNCKGGYLIFGVEDSGRILGLSSFAEPDNADLSNDINTYFSPAISFQSKTLKINDKTVFVIYVPERESVPTVCIKSFQKEIKESTVYWRYSGQAASIKAGDLINLFNEIKGEESRKQTKIAEKDFRAKFKPRLWINGAGGHSGDGTFKIPIDNRGPIGFLDSFEIKNPSVLAENIWLNTWNKEIAMQQGQTVQIRGKCHSSHAGHIDFDLVLKYHDQENYKYEVVVEWRQGYATMQTPKEL